MGSHRGVSLLHISGQKEVNVKVVNKGWRYSLEEGLEIDSDLHADVATVTEAHSRFDKTIDKAVLEIIE